MKSQRHYIDFLLDIYEQTILIQSFLKGLTLIEFQDNYQSIYAVCRSLEIIGEATKKVPIEITEKHSEISWNKMAGLRDIIIHHYYDLDETLIWNICKSEILPLQNNLWIIISYIYEKISDDKIKDILNTRINKIHSI